MATASVALYLALVCAICHVSLGQQAGNLEAEIHPEMSMQVDCRAGGCKQERVGLVLDANWRWLQKGGVNCFTDGLWDQTLCPDPQTCALDCALEGADYSGTYGVTINSRQDGVNLRFVTEHAYGSSVGQRLYVMDSDDTYKLFRLKNREFALDVDMSGLPCGLNGAVFFSEMDSRGDFDGKGNTAGARYGTGYCAASCPHDAKFIKGEANSLGWNASSDPPLGYYGACCVEMNIWEANSQAAAMAAHSCEQPGLVRCEGVECGDDHKGERYMGLCDKDGCDFNSHRMSNRSFYGRGPDFAVDTSKPFTVVTQFITEDGTDAGDLSEIRRFYVQGGVVIPNSQATVLGEGGGNSITDGFCSSQKEKFGDPNDFAEKGGMRNLGEALDRGMVLILSLWDDTQVNMLWLDSAWPLDRSPEEPGVQRGPCPGGVQSTPDYLRSTYPDAIVSYSSIKVGAINSTFAANGRRLRSSSA